jgi:hypothetical protein
LRCAAVCLDVLFTCIYNNGGIAAVGIVLTTGITNISLVEACKADRPLIKI